MTFELKIVPDDTLPQGFDEKVRTYLHNYNEKGKDIFDLVVCRRHTNQDQDKIYSSETGREQELIRVNAIYCGSKGTDEITLDVILDGDIVSAIFYVNYEGIEQ